MCWLSYSSKLPWGKDSTSLGPGSVNFWNMWILVLMLLAEYTQLTLFWRAFPFWVTDFGVKSRCWFRTSIVCVCVCARLVPPLTESKVCLQSVPRWVVMASKHVCRSLKFCQRQAEKRKTSEKRWESSMGDLSLNQKRAQWQVFVIERGVSRAYCSRARDRIWWFSMNEWAGTPWF